MSVPTRIPVTSGGCRPLDHPCFGALAPQTPRWGLAVPQIPSFVQGGSRPQTPQEKALNDPYEVHLLHWTENSHEQECNCELYGRSRHPKLQIGNRR